MHQLATTFEEYVQILAIESPHALILDWWRRLEVAINEYFEVHGVAVRSPIRSKELAKGKGITNCPIPPPQRHHLNRNEEPLGLASRTRDHL
jgi:hypothetical protein